VRALRGRGGRALRRGLGVPLPALRRQGARRQLPGVQAREAPPAARGRRLRGVRVRVQRLLPVHGRLRAVEGGAAAREREKGAGAATAERGSGAGGVGQEEGGRGGARVPSSRPDPRRDGRRALVGGQRRRWSGGCDAPPAGGRRARAGEAGARSGGVDDARGESETPGGGRSGPGGGMGRVLS
jgi:hypothetical protein